MAFRNALKLLIGKFRLVWKILLYLLIMFTVLACISVTFIVPVYRAFRAAGIDEMIKGILTDAVNGATLYELYGALTEAMSAAKQVLETDTAAFVNSTLFIVIIAVLLYRFLLGLYELPLLKVLQGAMSDNAKYSYTGMFVSTIFRSCLYSLIKMLVTIVLDTAILAAIYFGVTGAARISALLGPFVLMVLLLALSALRSSILSMWAPAIVVGRLGIFAALGYSLKTCFSSFGTLYSTYLITWLLILIVNIICGLFTFLAGLLISLPTSMLFVNLISMTLFYNKLNNRYYVGNTVVGNDLPPLL